MEKLIKDILKTKKIEKRNGRTYEKYLINNTSYEIYFITRRYGSNTFVWGGIEGVEYNNDPFSGKGAKQKERLSCIKFILTQLKAEKIV